MNKRILILIKINVILIKINEFLGFPSSGHQIFFLIWKNPIFLLCFVSELGNIIYNLLEQVTDYVV